MTENEYKLKIFPKVLKDLIFLRNDVEVVFDGVSRGRPLLTAEIRFFAIIIRDMIKHGEMKK